MQACPAVYDKGSFGNNILIHLVQRITKLRHTDTIQIENDGIKISGILPATLLTKI